MLICKCSKRAESCLSCSQGRKSTRRRRQAEEEEGKEQVAEKEEGGGGDLAKDTVRVVSCTLSHSWLQIPKRSTLR